MTATIKLRMPLVVSSERSASKRWKAVLSYPGHGCQLSVTQLPDGFRVEGEFHANARQSWLHIDNRAIGKAAAVEFEFRAGKKWGKLVVGWYDRPGPQSRIRTPVYTVSWDRRWKVGPHESWPGLCKMFMLAARRREPMPVLDWMQERLPDPWSLLGHDPVRFFASVSPYPLLGADGGTTDATHTGASSGRPGRARLEKVVTTA